MGNSAKQGKKLGKRFKNSEYDQEIPQSQTADNPVAPRGRAAQPTRLHAYQKFQRKKVHL